MTLACGIDHVIETDLTHDCKCICDEDKGRILFSVDGKEGQTVRLTKFITYHVSRSAPAAELCERADRALDRVVSHGFDLDTVYIGLPESATRYTRLRSKSKLAAFTYKHLMKTLYQAGSPRWASEPILCCRKTDTPKNTGRVRTITL